MFIQDDARLTIVNAHQAALRREAAGDARARRYTTDPGGRSGTIPFVGHAMPVAMVVRALVCRGREVPRAGRRAA